MVENDTIILARNDLKESMMKLLQNDIDILTTAPIELSLERNILGCYWKGGLKMKTIKQLFTLTNRIVRQNLTSVDTIITSIVMPIFILLFSFMSLVAIF